MGVGFEYFNYNPSLAAAIIFVVVFIVLVIGHLWKMFRARTWFLTALIVGGVFEAIGYAGRAAACEQTPNWTLIPYLTQELFILVAPALLAATIYMFLGRIITGLDGEEYSLIKKRWLTKIFVAGDVISFFIQAGGGGLMGSSDSSMQNTGQNVILGGLYFQIVLFCFFIVVAIIFHSRMRAMPTREAQDPAVKWGTYMAMLYICSALVLVRNAVRVVEFIQGFQGYILSHEYFLYIFDALLMALVMIILLIWHPARFMKSVEKRSYQLNSFDSATGLEQTEMTGGAQGSAHRWRK